MRYRLLGRSGLRVSELCLGAMVFGDTRGPWGTTREDAEQILFRFAEAGGNFIDTASNYAGGESERIVGELVGPDRDRWVLATKYSCSSRPDDPNAGGNHKKSLARSLETSLRRLNVDYVDVLWLHIWDALTPIEEVVRALDDVVRAGKALYVGVSDTPAWIVSRAVTMAGLRGWSPFVALQVPYSLLERSVERELLPMARGLDLAVTTWSPLGDGLLSGRYGSDRPQPADSRVAGVASHRLSECSLRIADAVNIVAKGRRRQPSTGSDRLDQSPATPRRDHPDHRCPHACSAHGQPRRAGDHVDDRRSRSPRRGERIRATGLPFRPRGVRPFGELVSASTPAPWRRASSERG
jgi:aryl-alcohol dehydrogenase-like predicted oxidoreductase